MKRREEDLRPHLLQFHTPMFWLLKIRGEASSELRMTEIKVEASQSLSTRTLYVTVATRKDISRNIVTSTERYETTKER